MRKLSVFGVLFLVLATIGVASAQSAPSVTIQMQATGGSKVTGTAVLTQSGNGVEVNVKLSGFDPSTKHDGHIHVGSCAAQGGVVVPLDSITADASGAGSADTTESTLTFAQVTDGKHYVQYHISSNPPGNPVSCADIPAQAATQGQGGAPGAPAAGLGSVSQESGFPVALLAGLLGLMVITGAGYRLVRKNGK
jgi:hypothetical protein